MYRLKWQFAKLFCSNVPTSETTRICFCIEEKKILTSTHRNGDGTGVPRYLRSIFTCLHFVKRQYSFKSVINPSTLLEHTILQVGRFVPGMSRPQPAALLQRCHLRGHAEQRSDGLAGDRSDPASGSSPWTTPTTRPFSIAPPRKCWGSLPDRAASGWSHRIGSILKQTSEEEGDKTPLPTPHFDILQPRGRISALPFQQKRKVISKVCQCINIPNESWIRECHARLSLSIHKMFRLQQRRWRPSRHWKTTTLSSIFTFWVETHVSQS